MRKNTPDWLDKLCEQLEKIAQESGVVIMPAPESEPKPEPRPLTDTDYAILARFYGLTPEPRDRHYTPGNPMRKRRRK